MAISVNGDIKNDAWSPKPTVVPRDHRANMDKAVQRNHDMLMTTFDGLEADADFPGTRTVRSRLNRLRDRPEARTSVENY